MSASGRQALEQDLADERVRDAAHEMLNVLHECEEYFDGRADVLDGDYGVPRPNREMQILSEIRDALRRAGVS